MGVEFCEAGLAGVIEDEDSVDHDSGGEGGLDSRGCVCMGLGITEWKTYGWI